MSKNQKNFLEELSLPAIITIVLVADFVLGIYVGSRVTHESTRQITIRKLAIQSGCGKFNSRTDEFEYTKECPWEKNDG